MEVLLFSFGALIFVIVFLFLWKSKQLKHVHLLMVEQLQQELYTHQEQISYRNLHLDKYRFLDHNLSEVLKPQPQINCKFA